LRKAAIATVFAGFASLGCPFLHGQESFKLDATQSFGFSSTYSANSSHILIGDAEQRRIWTLGMEYTHILSHGPRFRLDYEGSLMPLYEETDPTVSGTTFTLGGQTFVNPVPTTRVIYAVRGPVGSLITPGGFTAPIYAITGRQDTYAAAVAPFGVRVSAFQRWRVQPTCALDLGFVVSHSDIPIDQASQFNFMFSFGPGVQLFTSRDASLRLEYIYRHTSNAGLGNQNPGVDQGVTRVTLSRRW
jgi:hypothetical protein